MNIDILFENKYVRTKEFLKNERNYFYLKQPFFILIDIILLATIIGGIINYFMFYQHNKTSDNLPLSQVLLLILCIVIVQVIPFCTYIKSALARDMELTQGKLKELTITVTSSEIKITHNNGYQIVPLCKVLKAIYTKNLIVLHTQSDVKVVMQKDSFTKGSSEQFADFLKFNKCVVKGN